MAKRTGSTKSKSESSKPVAVIISDIHYNLTTLPLADAALKAALRRAEELDVPCIVAGDLHDTKAILRGECVSAMLATLNAARCPVLILVGNHDRIHEKEKAHSLEFLRTVATVIEEPCERYGLHLLPYESDPEALLQVLKEIPKGSTLVMHQGVQTANMGHYIQDKTSLPPEAFSGFRVVSGHYHLAQTIQCGTDGVMDYIGNPYTLGWGEAGHGPKGFRVLMSDGTLPLVELPLPRHVIIETTVEELSSLKVNARREDHVWLKVHGPKSQLIKIDKKSLGQRLLGHSNYKLDLIKDDADEIELKSEKLTEAQILDTLIDNLADTPEHKAELKRLWRQLV